MKRILLIIKCNLYLNCKFYVNPLKSTILIDAKRSSTEKNFQKNYIKVPLSIFRIIICNHLLVASKF